MLNFNLTPDQSELRQKAISFALKEMNGDIPKEYGGRGAGLVEAALVTEEIAAACPGIDTSLSGRLGLDPDVSDRKTPSIHPSVYDL